MEELLTYEKSTLLNTITFNFQYLRTKKMLYNDHFSHFTPSSICDNSLNSTSTFDYCTSWFIATKNQFYGWDGNSSSSSSIFESFTNWLMTTTTPFYGWDDQQVVGPLFGLLCLSYSLSGMLMLICKPKQWTRKSNFPQYLYSLSLIVQGLFFSSFVLQPLEFVFQNSSD